MVFEWNRMVHTPEGEFGRAEGRKRQRDSLDVIVNTYWDQAEKILNGKSSTIVKDEVARFAKHIIDAREGVEQDEYVDNLLNALRMRRAELPEGIETRRERTAFGAALARAFLRSAH